jgi:hypothetical protein
MQDRDPIERVVAPARVALRPTATLLALAVVAGFLARPARVSQADLVLTADGKWQPIPESRDPNERIVVPGPDDEPNDDLLLHPSVRENNVDATYETVRSKAVNKPAAQVKKIRSSAAVENTAFRQGINAASSGEWADAAEAFHAAAGELSGFGKQEALWNCAKTTSFTGDADRTSTAIDELLAAFPKSFYFADAYIIRARIAANKGDLSGASAAIDKIKGAAGMNTRDAYRGEYARVFLTMEIPRKFDAAATEYKALVSKMEGEKDAALVASIKQQCQVGLGNCLLALKKESDARAYFQGATESRDPDVLAGAYAGLGDIALTDAKSMMDTEKRKEAKDKLEEALLYYLRVSKLYGPNVNEEAPVVRAKEASAKIFRTLFEMGNKKEIALIERSWKAYDDYVKSVTGPQRAAAVKAFREVDELWKTLKAAGASPAPAPAAPAPAKDAAMK